MKNQGKGVYFSKAMYAGFIRRTFCLLIDLMFVIALLILLIQFKDTFPELTELFQFFYLLWFIFTILYFSIIKSSKIQTFGYRILRLKIVDLFCNKPSHLQMLLRCLISLIGPFQLPHDILWMYDDDNKQSLRDKFAGTYVIKKNAKPIGSNQIVGKYYFINGFHFSLKKYSALIRL